MPVVTDFTRAFWSGGRASELRIQRCGACRVWLHPPKARCPQCSADDLRYEPASGRATVYTFTLAHHVYRPNLLMPYVIALVELPEQPGLRVTTNIVGCDPGAVHIGMPVRVTFEQIADSVYVPLFVPDLT
jgi:uncharacterized OB-fold protein